MDLLRHALHNEAIMVHSVHVIPQIPHATLVNIRSSLPLTGMQPHAMLAEVSYHAGACPLTAPHIQFLSQAAVLPLAPTADQIQYCSGDSTTLWQRLGWSLLATLLTLKLTALAASSATFTLWYPSLQAALRNRSVRGKSRCGTLSRGAL
jgi:hypothetical protein